MPAEFGATPWGKAWLRTIQSTSTGMPNTLLPKARTLARNTTSIVAVGTGHVDADVTASGEVCRVRIGVPLWPDGTQPEVGRLVAKAAAEHHGLVAGDLPDTLEADLRQHGIGVAADLAELRSSCTCRSRKRPCPHILATIYALVQLIDERPALAIELRSDAARAAATADPDWVALSEVDPAGFYGD